MLRFRAIAMISAVLSGVIAPTFSAHAGTLSCTVTTSCPTGVVLLRMYDPNGNHAELSSQSNYSYMVCCSGVLNLGNSCVTGTTATVLRLSGTTNAHVEENSQSNYANSACLSVDTGGTVQVGYQATNCAGYDTTIGSITAATNSHIGDGNAYPIKVCATALPPSILTASISDNAVGFGGLTSSSTRYATADETGSSSEVAAHTIVVSTTAYNGYVVTVRGTSLSDGSHTISPIGGTNTSPSPGSEQFGLRLTASGGSGSVSSPYAASGFAFNATGSTPVQVAQAASGDNISTTYSARYVANVSSTTEAGSYGTVLEYIITATY